MNFIFSWQKQYFTHSLRSFVKYCFCHSKIKFISSRHRVISSIYDTRAMLVLNLPNFENKKYTANDRFHGNGPYGKIPTKKEPIRTLGFTLPYNKNPYFTFEFRSCPDSFNGSICLESAQATYVTSLFKSSLKYAKLAAVFSKIHRTRIVGMQDVKETHKVI